MVVTQETASAAEAAAARTAVAADMVAAAAQLESDWGLEAEYVIG